MNDRLIDALFSVSSRVREIRMEMDKLVGDGSDSDGIGPPTLTPHRASTPLFARKEERTKSKPYRRTDGNLPLQRGIKRPGAQLMIKVSNQGRECYMSGEPCRET